MQKFSSSRDFRQCLHLPDVIKLSEKVDAINRLHVSTVQKRLITHENKAIKLGIGALANLLIRNLENIVLNNARH